VRTELNVEIGGIMVGKENKKCLEQKPVPLHKIHY
jgi:hypothetical protein